MLSWQSVTRREMRMLSKVVGAGCLCEDTANFCAWWGNIQFNPAKLGLTGALIVTGTAPIDQLPRFDLLYRKCVTGEAPPSDRVSKWLCQSGVLRRSAAALTRRHFTGEHGVTLVPLTHRAVQKVLGNLLDVTEKQDSKTRLPWAASAVHGKCRSYMRKVVDKDD